MNIDTAERLGVAAAGASGMKGFEDVLEAKVKAVASEAKSLDVNIGIEVVDALKHMS